MLAVVILRLWWDVLASTAEPVVPNDVIVQEYCRHWDALYERMQYGTVDRPSAGRVLRWISRQLKTRVEAPPDSNFYFPLENHGLSDVGGKNGNGFVRRRYNFLHGNSHRGHPAHDIFIHDDDQDGLDDRMRRPVHVLAMASGIVVGVKEDWAAPDTLRGGNYVMIYNPSLNRYYYYAHNQSILVKVGDIVQGGQPIATVGRTGRTAFPKRSPTHLHLMVLQLTDDRGEPFDYYPELVRSVKVSR